MEEEIEKKGAREGEGEEEDENSGRMETGEHGSSKGEKGEAEQGRCLGVRK